MNKNVTFLKGPFSWQTVQHCLKPYAWGTIGVCSETTAVYAVPARLRRSRESTFSHFRHLSSRLRDGDIRFFQRIYESKCYPPTGVKSFCVATLTSTSMMHLMQMVRNFYAFYVHLCTPNMLVNQITQQVTSDPLC